jgi:hypothetical protein
MDYNDFYTYLAILLIYVNSPELDILVEMALGIKLR